MNLHKLKHDVWSEINDKLLVDEYKLTNEENKLKKRKLNEDENQEEEKKETEDLSFQNLLKKLSNEQEQRDVTLPYYFICLLHLANEKVSYFI